jgi:hypothetical protein
MKAISLKLEEHQLQELSEVSRASGVPKSVLIRKGVDLVLRQAREEGITAALRREVDSVISEDRKLLGRLAKA